MAMDQALLEQIKELNITGKTAAAKKLIEDNIDALDPLTVIEGALAPAMAVIGDRFGNGEIYLPEMMKAAKTFEAVMAALQPKILSLGQKIKKLGSVVFGTVSKDVHEIGKNIVINLLSTGGFEVHDIGYDKPAMEFVRKAQEVGADIIAASALMTTTMPYQRDIVETLESMGLRDKYKVIVGGGAVTQKWADEIGADGYAADAASAVNMAKELLL